MTSGKLKYCWPLSNSITVKCFCYLCPYSVTKVWTSSPLVAVMTFINSPFCKNFNRYNTNLAVFKFEENSSERLSSLIFDPFSTSDVFNFASDDGGECKTTRSLKTTCFNGLSRAALRFNGAGDDERLRCRSRSAGGTGGGRMSPTVEVAGGVATLDVDCDLESTKAFCERWVSEMHTSPTLSCKKL